MTGGVLENIHPETSLFHAVPKIRIYTSSSRVSSALPTVISQQPNINVMSPPTLHSHNIQKVRKVNTVQHIFTLLYAMKPNKHTVLY